MSDGSYCPTCGFRTGQVMLNCPRCLQLLQHSHCSRCGRCPRGKPTPGKKDQQPKKARTPDNLRGF